MITHILYRNRRTATSLLVKGQFRLFHCTVTRDRIEPMSVADTPRTKENSAGWFPSSFQRENIMPNSYETGQQINNANTDYSLRFCYFKGKLLTFRA